MARSGRMGSFAAVVAALALLASPLPALAAFAVNIAGSGAYGGGGITVNDNGTDDLNPALGQISLIAGLSATLPAIPGFAFSLTTAVTNSPGGPSVSSLSLLPILASTSGGTIVVTASATDFAFPASGVGSILTSSVGGTLSSTVAGSVSAQQYVDLANGLFALGAVTPGPQGPFSSLAFSNSASTFFTSVPLYSITDRLSLTLSSNAATADTLQSTVVPEPITMFLGGTGLLALGYAGRRRLFGR